MPDPTPRTPVISLGAGVQSTAMTLLAARRELEGVQPALAIFADTGHEPRAVYAHLEWLEAEVAGRVEVVRVQGVDLVEEVDAGRYNPVPLYTGAGGVGRRQCTYQAKLRPMRAELRRRGFGPRRPVLSLLGITVDEVQRVKPSGLEWLANGWPLLDMGWRRRDCLAWMEAQGYPPPPRSACTFCPFHTDAEWRAMREGDPESWEAAVAYDAKVRGRGEFVHRSLRAAADGRPHDARGPRATDARRHGRVRGRLLPLAAPVPPRSTLRACP